LGKNIELRLFIGRAESVERPQENHIDYHHVDGRRLLECIVANQTTRLGIAT